MDSISQVTTNQGGKKIEEEILRVDVAGFCGVLGDALCRLGG